MRIPIRVVDGAVRSFDAGALPRIVEGTPGELVVHEAALLDPADVEAPSTERVVVLVPSGAAIFLSVNPDRPLPDRIPESGDGRVSEAARGCGRVVVRLGEDLRLRLRGSKPASLEPVRCTIPSLQKEASSINEAYRIVSEHYETGRRSHSGNVFESAFASAGDGWRSLGDLRDARSAAARREGESALDPDPRERRARATGRRAGVGTDRVVVAAPRG